MKRSIDNNSFVLFLDILGFKDFILNNDKKLIEQKIKVEFMDTINAGLSLMYRKEGKLTLTQNNGLVDFEQSKFNIYIMSDSIIIWTNDTEKETFDDLCKFATNHLFCMFISGIPLRGGIAKGEVIVVEKSLNGIKQTSIVGSGIVKAYEVESIQNWMGIGIDSQITCEETNDVIKTTVPMKNGTKDMYVLDWSQWIMETIKDPLPLSFFEDNFAKYGKSIEDPRVKEKIQNTYEFYLNMKKLKGY